MTFRPLFPEHALNAVVVSINFALPPSDRAFSQLEELANDAQKQLEFSEVNVLPVQSVTLNQDADAGPFSQISMAKAFELHSQPIGGRKEKALLIDPPQIQFWTEKYPGKDAMVSIVDSIQNWAMNHFGSLDIESITVLWENLFVPSDTECHSFDEVFKRDFCDSVLNFAKEKQQWHLDRGWQEGDSNTGSHTRLQARQFWSSFHEQRKSLLAISTSTTFRSPISPSNYRNLGSFFANETLSKYFIASRTQNRDIVGEIFSESILDTIQFGKSNAD